MCRAKCFPFLFLFFSLLVGCRASAPPPTLYSSLPEKKHHKQNVVIDKKKERENFTALLADINDDTRLKQKEILVKEDPKLETSDRKLLLESPKFPALGVKRWEIENFQLQTNTETDEEVAELGCPDPKIGAVCDCMLIESAVFAEQSAEKAYRVAEKTLLTQKTPKEWKGHGWDIETILASYDGRDEFDHIPTWTFTFHPKGKEPEKSFRVAVETKNYTVSSLAE